MLYNPADWFGQDGAASSTSMVASSDTSAGAPHQPCQPPHEHNTDHTLEPPDRDVCRCIHLAGRPAAVRYARDAIQEELRGLGLDEAADETIRQCAESVLLIVSELVTNACRHSPGPADLRTSWQGHTLTVEVDDYGEDIPHVVEGEDRGAGGGFGMCLIETLSDGWGVQPQDEGKTVYAHVTFP